MLLSSMNREYNGVPYNLIFIEDLSNLHCSLSALASDKYRPSMKDCTCELPYCRNLYKNNYLAFETTEFIQKWKYYIQKQPPTGIFEWLFEQFETISTKHPR